VLAPTGKIESGSVKSTRMGWARLLTAGAAVILGLALFVAAESSLTQAASKPATQSSISEIVLTLDPVQSQVHWTLNSTLHTVHGTFSLKSGIVHFNPDTGTAGGEIVIYAPSGQSGNASRDKRMHKEILETARYPEVMFRPTRVEGKVSRSGASDVKLEGTLSIHGADHDVTAQVHAELAGERWTGSGTFKVPYVQWGIKDPSNFLLKAEPAVTVEVEMSGQVKAAN
jgi:polyisoprenoid-binding protein YceI